MFIGNRGKKLLSMILFLLLVIASFPAVAEESTEGGKGTVIVLESSPEEAFDEVEEISEPFIPDGLEENGFNGDGKITMKNTAPLTIFDGDGRITVNNPAVYPYCAIAYMYVHAECGCTKYGTAFMVGKDRLLTAAHCLICIEHGKWADGIDFYFGYKNSNNYVYKYADRWTAYAGNIFRDGKYTIDYDYGCIKLYENVGDRVGWFGTIWGYADESFSDTLLTVAGFGGGSTLRYDRGYVSAKDWQHIVFSIDTLPGNSGSPIYTDDYYAIGINIAESDYANYGYRLTNEVHDALDGL